MAKTTTKLERERLSLHCVGGRTEEITSMIDGTRGSPLREVDNWVRYLVSESLSGCYKDIIIVKVLWSISVGIMTFANQPYPGRINQKVFQFVTGGKRLDKQEDCVLNG